MSYDIRLTEPTNGETILLDHPHQMRGGTYAVGGTNEAWLNVTYNYSCWYYKDGVFPSFPDDDFHDGRSGIRSIYQMSGAESIPVLQHAIDTISAMDDPIAPEEAERLAKERGSMYWVETKENALRPLYQLMAMARMRPDGVWDGD